MSSKILHFDTNRFKNEATLEQSGSRCTVRELAFIKGDTWAHEEVAKVLSFCNQYRNRGISTIVLQGEKDITVWIEDRSTAISESQARSASIVNQQSSAQSQALPTKTVIKRYRGQEYEETVVDWAKMQQTQQPKPRRKYRGQYID